MKRKKIPYFYILVAICLLTILILVLPFTMRESEPPPEVAEETAREPDGELTAGEIIERSREAHGGRKELLSLESVQLRTSSILGTQQAEHAEETAWYLFPDRMRSEARIGSTTFVQVYDRGSSWIREGEEISEADMATTEILRRSLKHFPTFLVRAADSTAIAIMKGRSFIDGKPQYRIHIIEQDADETTLWIDSSDYLLRRMDYPVFAGDAEQHMQLDFDSYEKREGIMLPNEVDLYLNGVLIQQTTVLEYRLNVGVPDTLLQRP